MAYAVMPYADYQDACEAVREKTGGTEVIKSGDLGDLIRGISGGAEVVSGTYTQESANNSITISALIGKENFSIAFYESYDDDDAEANMIVYCKRDAAAGQFAMMGCYAYSGGCSPTTISVDATTTTWDSATGTLKRTMTPARFPAGEWLYIGW